MILLTLLFTLLSPSESNDQLLIERMEQNLEMIASLDLSIQQNPSSDGPSKNDLIEENGKILAFYFLPERMYENERGVAIIQSLLQQLRLLSYNYSNETMDQVRKHMNRLKKYINQSHLIKEKPWERGWQYKKRPAIKRRSQKNDPRNPRCPAR